MGFTRFYFKDKNFVLTRISGDVNDQNLREHVTTLNGETKGILDLRELADCRDITNVKQLTVKGTVNSSLSESNRPESLLALLVTDSTLLYGMARAYQTFSEEKRKEVRIFNDIDKALAWLAKDNQEMELLKGFVNSNCGVR